MKDSIDCIIGPVIFSRKYVQSVNISNTQASRLYFFMERLMIYRLLLCVALSASMLVSGVHAKQIDATSLKGTGIHIESNVSALPENGIVETWSVNLPAYDEVMYFSTDGKDRFLAAANRIFSWPANQLKDLIVDGYQPQPAGSSPSRNGLLVVFKLTDGDYLVLHGLAGPKSISFFRLSDSGALELNLATFGTAKLEGDMPLLAWSKTPDVHEAFRAIYAKADQTEPLASRFNLREDKHYPEPFKYLGWASWEQYRRKISSDLLVDAMKEIEKSELPVRWVLVDDGHQDQTGTGMSDSRLLSFNGHKEFFPEGFKPLMALRSDKIRWISIWHAMNAQWQGLHENHTEEGLREYLFKSKKNGAYTVKNNPEASKVFYETMIGRSVEQGFDFVKIDNQNRVLPYYEGTDNGVEAVARNAQNLEEVAERLTQGLINCFAADIITIFNTKHSNVSRVSVDYLLNSEEKAKSHLYQSYQNTLWMGQAVWPDHDMFHSSDKVSGRMMSVSKALGGAPIYLSDAPKDFVAEMVMPLAYHDGELLRPLAPAAPLADSVMLDAMNVERPYRVIAPLANGAVSIAAYNLVYPTPKQAIPARITAEDYKSADIMRQGMGERAIPEEGLVYFDWYAQRGAKLEGRYEFTLNGFVDRLVQLSPIKNGWSVVGRSDKYLSATAVKDVRYSDNQLTLTMAEQGPLVVYSQKKPQVNVKVPVESLGNSLWKVALPSADAAVKLMLTR